MVRLAERKRQGYNGENDQLKYPAFTTTCKNSHSNAIIQINKFLQREVIIIITVESVLLKQIEELNKALAQAKKEAAENLQYRELHEGKVNRNAKDSVFVNLFSYPEYQMRIYNELSQKILRLHRVKLSFSGLTEF